ncbi:Tn3 family transposase [Candidatus Methylospira mobilis]|uniref:Tn3 family transposase n=1 Tax=Candidatus Methylospira mobilis TaxID=1808979 RepID=UPI0028E463D5|nr:Tn3 family transposase [Candidatus Methylospira mobilis]WNV03390.1 Tn3 family transposase [Candidatus Methylospira mobilis]WNV04758.1 Tn3 family transposase [Candidatus Methylospira mobilis]
MPRRSILSAAERASLLALPDTEDELIRYYTFSETDLSLIRQRRGDANRLGVAVQMCLLRFPGQGLLAGATVPVSLLQWIGRQLRIDPRCWPQYAERDETRREHLLELRAYLNMEPFGMTHYRQTVQAGADLALQTDKGVVLAASVIDALRHRHIIIPALDVVERVCAEAITRANRRIYEALSEPLSNVHRHRLDDLLKRRDNGKTTWLAWLRQSPAKPNSRHMLEHIERLKAWQALDLPAGIERLVHQNRLLKIAREGGQMTPADLAKFEPQRRYATLVALAIEGMATVTDEIIDLHDRIMGKLFRAAKNKHQQQFQASGKAINAKLRLYGRIGQALLDAKQSGGDPFVAIEAIMPWDAFAESVTEAQKLAQPEAFDFLHRIGEGYATLRRYAPEFLNVLKLRAAPSAKYLLDAIEVLRGMNTDSARKVPADAPTRFIKPRWHKLVVTDAGIDRRYYELCVLSELKNSLRSGDVWAQGARQFKDFEDYLVPTGKFSSLKQSNELPLAVVTDCDQYLQDRLTLLKEQLATVNRMAAANDLPDAIITVSGLKVTPLDAAVPDTAQALIDQTASILPHVKITELLLEVDEWTGFTRHFTHLKSGDLAKDKNLLLTTILADAINLGLTKMAESCPGTTYAKLAWLQAWHIRDETYSTALAELVNAHFRHPFAEHWGDGTSSSSDGQNFRTGSKAESTGHINPKYGSSPGRTFYTHISDQYAPFHTKVVNVGLRDSTYVLDGLLYHESDLRIEEHYTDTAGFTDHVFALMHLLGFRFAPRIRDLGDTKLYIPKDDAAYDALKPMIGGTLNIKHIRAHWDEILRLATSIKQGTVTASLMLRKLGSYPRQNGLAVALRELGRIERTLFMLDWLQSVELRRRVHAGLNKGEARNALARAVFFNRLGEIRDRSFEQQRYRASGLNLVTAAIVLWNTVYLERATHALRSNGHAINDELLQYLSPLGWEHINLTGDYLWRSNAKIGAGKFRPLRPL